MCVSEISLPKTEGGPNEFDGKYIEINRSKKSE